MSFTPTLGTPITSPAIVPGGAVLEPPVGGTAGAAKGKDAISQEEFEGLLERANDQATNVKKIPGGAAGAAPAEEAPRGALLPPVALRVVDLVPVPRNELLSRPVAPVDSEEMQMIRALIGGKKISGGILDELTVTGGLPREDWLRLTMQELRLVKTAAQAEHKAEGGNSISLRILALDRMIGAAIKSKAKGVTSVAQYDPRLTVDQRCEVDGQALGIISKVTNAHYLVDLDDGERLSIDRALKVQLQRLKASDAPALAPRRVTGPVVLADVGTQWQPKDGGNVVTVERIEGSQRGLSNGTNLPVYTLTTKFEQVGA